MNVVPKHARMCKNKQTCDVKKQRRYEYLCSFSPVFYRRRTCDEGSFESLRYKIWLKFDLYTTELTPVSRHELIIFNSIYILFIR